MLLKAAIGEGHCYNGGTMLSISPDGASFTPQPIDYVGRYANTSSAGMGDIWSPRPPSAADITSFNTGTSKQIGVNWSEPTNDGIPAQAGVGLPIGRSALSTDIDFKAYNASNGAQYLTTGNSWTNTGLASGTTYGYRIYSGNDAWSPTTSSSTKYATTKKDAVRTTVTKYAAWSESYNQNGTKRNTSHLYHGDLEGGNDRKGVWGFNLGNTFTGTTIHSIKIYLNALWWYYNAGGSCGLYVATNQATSEPSSMGTPTAAAGVTITWTSKTGAKWITLPSSFGSAISGGTNYGNRYWWVGGSTLSQYGYFAGYGDTGRPALQIDYTYYA